MDHIFVVGTGGGGTCHLLQNARRMFYGNLWLIQAIGKRISHKVCRPETMKPHPHPGKQFCKIKSPQEKPNLDHIKEFKKKSGYTMSPEKSIRENMIDFVKYRRQKPGLTLVTWIAIWDIFLELQIKNVLFYLRHPVHSYSSFLAPHRHGKDLEMAGFLKEDIKTAEMIVEMWNDLVLAHERMQQANLEPKLILYDAPDIESLNEHAFLFENARFSPNTHWHKLPTEIVDYIVEKSLWQKIFTEEQFFKGKEKK